MRIRINDKEQEFLNELSVAELLRQQDITAKGTAIAVNDEVINRQLWPHTLLRDGDKVSLFSVVAGG